ncbi:MAG: YjbH domain-containing protein [Fretibacterium sp.]|nr:YjbH domain-containing protein [Fretibacterium sp.]
MVRRSVIVLFLICSLCASRAGAVTSSNAGFTGLWEYPTAEMPGDGHGRFGYTHVSPYRYYFLDLAWLPWLEVNARFTNFDNIWVTWKNSFNQKVKGRYYMDKAIDLKAMLYRSKQWYLPSLAAGVTDMMGTELMKSWYGVATWRWGDFSVSAGYGSDRMNGFFGGIAWDVTDWLTVKAEYSPMDYEADRVGSFRVHPDAPASKFNYGLVLKAPWGTEVSFSRQRDEEYVFTFSQRLNLNGPFLFTGSPRRRRINVPGEARIPEWEDTTPEELLDRIERGLEKHVRVRDVDIEIGNRTVLVAYENYGHASHAEAMVRVLVVLSAVLPQTDTVILVPRISGVPIVRAEFPGFLMFDIRARSLRGENFLQPAVFAWAQEGGRSAAGKALKSGEAPASESAAASQDVAAVAVPKTAEEGEGGALPPEDGLSPWREGAYRSGLLADRARHTLKAMIVYEPRLDQTLDDDYQNRWSLDLIYQGRYSKGWGAYVDVRFPLYNNVNIWWEPDMNDKIRLQQAAALYVKNLTGGRNGVWLMGEAGWLDEEYFGVNLWARWYMGRGWLGARLAAQRDRHPELFADFVRGKMNYRNISGPRQGEWRGSEGDPWRWMAWFQAGYNFANPDLDLQLDWGRYADTDVGVKIAAVRHWDDTALGFWWTRTDRLTTDRDYTRAGVHMEIPAEKWFGSWFGRPSDHVWEQDTMLLSTWRIDAGREGGHVRTPERLLGQLRPMVLKQNVTQLLKDYCSFDETAERNSGAQSLAELFFPRAESEN